MKFLYSQLWWFLSVILTLERLRQEDCIETEAILGHTIDLISKYKISSYVTMHAHLHKHKTLKQPKMSWAYQQKQEESYWLISKQTTKLVTLNQNSTDINGTEQEPRKKLTYLLPNITDKNDKNTNWRKKQDLEKWHIWI